MERNAIHTASRIIPAIADGNIAGAIVLAEKLIAELKGVAPDPGVITQAPSIEWQPLASAKPPKYEICWVVHWNADGVYVEHICRAYWVGDWYDGGDSLIDELLDVPDQKLYWVPSTRFASLDVAESHFTKFIKSAATEPDLSYYDPIPDYDFDPS